MSRPARLVRISVLFATIILAAKTAPVPPPQSWPPDAFLPVTEARIAELPPAEQAAWKEYCRVSASYSEKLPKRDLVDHSPVKPMVNAAPIGSSYSKGIDLHASTRWYASKEARTIADRVVQWQRPSGGWTKSGDYTRDPKPEDDHHDVWSSGTFDNDSTITELRFLALVQHAASTDPRAAAWRESFQRGLAYIFAAQYPNGGWPQIYPLVGWYHDAITFNDDAMVHILQLLRDIAERKPELAFVPAQTVTEASARVERGIACVLATQLRNAKGQLTVWGQQHDALTLKPCAARNFEPIAECSNESVGLVDFLMTIPKPSPAIVAAVDAAVVWFKNHALHGVAWDRNATTGSGLVEKPGFHELWARFYEIGSGRPIFGDRDRSIHYTVTELSSERRLGYGWFNSRAIDLPGEHARWKRTLAAK